MSERSQNSECVSMIPNRFIELVLESGREVSAAYQAILDLFHFLCDMPLIAAAGCFV